MQRFCSRILCGVVIIVAGLGPVGCGDLELAEVDVKPLKMVGLYPQTGEVVSAQDLMVVVVFSETVGFQTGSTDVNSDTFFLEDQDGNPVEGTTVGESGSDTSMHATAVLSLNASSLLVSGETYWVVLKGTIQGTDANGNQTDPLGEDIRSHFVVE